MQSPDSPLDFQQAQTAVERSGVMLPTSARVAQEVYEPLKEFSVPCCAAEWKTLGK